MSSRSIILTTTAALAGLGIAATMPATLAAAPTPTIASTGTSAYTVSGTLSPASFQDSLNQAYLAAEAAGVLPSAADAPATDAVSDEVAAWASSPKSMDVKFCESTHNYAINTGNGYYGAWQFDYPSWHANGGGAYAEYPHEATPAQQDQIAYTYWLKAGWGPWECG
jgi:hypothetical protein